MSEVITHQNAARVWVDTDVGTNVDDAFALAFAVRHPGVDLAGVSTVYANTALRARIGARIIELAGGHFTPSAGYGRPMTPGLEPVLGGHEGQGLLDSATLSALTSPGQPETDFDATTKLLSRIAELPAEVQIAAIGPLTNLAWLHRNDTHPRTVTAVGGTTRPGTGSDWNWTCDPAAASVVLDANLKLRLLPYDVTSRVWLDDADMDGLRSGDELCRLLAELTRRWLAVRPALGKPPPHRAYLHDPLTLVTVTDTELFEFTEACIEVVEGGAARLVDGEPNCQVATGIDARAAKAAVLGQILRP